MTFNIEECHGNWCKQWGEIITGIKETFGSSVPLKTEEKSTSFTITDMAELR